MGKFRNVATGVVVTVDDSKDDRYANPLWESPEKAAPAKKVAARKTAKSE